MNNVTYDIASISDCFGKIVKINTGEAREIEMFEIESRSKQLLKDIIHNGIKRNNQSIILKCLSINKCDYDWFAEGQTRLKKVGNHIIFTGEPINYTRFKCILQTPILCSDGYIWGSEIIIPSIEFYIADSTPIIDDETVIYSNIQAMIYDKCMFRLLENEEN